MNVRRLHPARVWRSLWLKYHKRRSRTIPLDKLEAARLGIVASIYNRSDWRVDNFLKTLSVQTLPRRSYDIVLVDFGSSPEHRSAVAEKCRRYGVRYLVVEGEGTDFNKSRCNNVGIRAHGDAVRYIMCTDADMIFAPDFLETVLRVQIEFEPALVMSQLRRLPAQARTDNIDVLAQFAALAPLAEDAVGTGPCLAAPTRWWHEARGFDERIPYYGEDTDLQVRSERAGLHQIWISDMTTFLHQWHEPFIDMMTKRGPEALAQWNEKLAENHRLLVADTTVVRNAATWGTAKTLLEVD